MPPGKRTWVSGMMIQGREIRGVECATKSSDAPRGKNPSGLALPLEAPGTPSKKKELHENQWIPKEGKKRGNGREGGLPFKKGPPEKTKRLDKTTTQK